MEHNYRPGRAEKLMRLAEKKGEEEEGEKRSIRNPATNKRSSSPSSFIVSDSCRILGCG
jgi:hypothetical protein